MNFHIITLFPESFESYLSSSILKRAIFNKKISIKFYNPRNFAKNKRQVDDRPFGGGPGMVIKAEPVIKAIEKAKGRKKRVKLILTTPYGNKFTNDYAKKISKNYKDIIIIAGHYEGIDSRVRKVFKMDDISIGDYVLTGGELPALVVIDCVSRQVKGVLGKEGSLEENRVSGRKFYTRPESFKYKGKTHKVPKVLLSGNHKDIDKWREISN